jgi:hypothetical protein
MVDSDFEPRIGTNGKQRKKRSAVEFKQKRVIPLVDICCIDLKQFVGDTSTCRTAIVASEQTSLPSFFGLNWQYIFEILMDAPELIEEHSCSIAPKTCCRLKRYADALHFAADRLKTGYSQSVSDVRGRRGTKRRAKTVLCG